MIKSYDETCRWVFVNKNESTINFAATPNFHWREKKIVSCYFTPIEKDFNLDQATTTNYSISLDRREQGRSCRAYFISIEKGCTPN